MSENTAQQAKTEKLKELGLLCYNSCVDGLELPGMTALIEDVKTSINNFFAARRNSADEKTVNDYGNFLDEKLVELGSLCCSLYTNRVPLNEEITLLCRDICLESRASWNPVDTGANYRKKAKKVQNDDSPADKGDNIPATNMQKVCSCGYVNALDSNFCVMCGSRLA